MIKKTLIDNMNSTDFVDNMTEAFNELRSDFDLSSLSNAIENIMNLEKNNVDLLGKINTLKIRSLSSNGILKGSRGAGKSHNLLLARHKINSETQSFCVYINLSQHIKIDGVEFLDERFFSWVILKEFFMQLEQEIIKIESEKDFLGKVHEFLFNSDGKRFEKFKVIYTEVENILSYGETQFSSLSKNYEIQDTSGYSEQANVEMEVSPTAAKGKASAGYSQSSQVVEKDSEQMISLINLNTLKKYLIDIKELLDYQNIIFYYDEWSALKSDQQHKLSVLIKALSISPLYHWIAIVPYLSNLGVLEETADLPNSIDLDLQLVYEYDSDLCKKYFKEFMNQRINTYLDTTDITWSDLLSQNNFNRIVIASMGNTRDFGIILNNCWDLYLKDYKAGKTYKKYSQKRHVDVAINSLGQSKYANIDKENKANEKRMWISVREFSNVNQFTQFCIEDNSENVKAVTGSEFQELLYHRIIHLRRRGLSHKDGQGRKVDLYSCNVSLMYPKIYQVKDESSQVFFADSEEIIHDKVRRFLFPITELYNKFRVEDGSQILHSCGAIITSKMKFNLEHNACPECGGKIFDA